MEEKYVVYQVNGFCKDTHTYVNGVLVEIRREGLSKEEAMNYRNELNKLRTPWEKGHIGIVYKLAKESKVRRY